MRSALRAVATLAVVAGLVVAARFVSATPPPPEDEVAPALVVAPVDPHAATSSPLPAAASRDGGAVATVPVPRVASLPDDGGHDEQPAASGAVR